MKNITVSLDEETYRRIWNGKAALTQILHDRQAATLGRAATDPDVQRLEEQIARKRPFARLVATEGV